MRPPRHHLADILVLFALAGCAPDEPPSPHESPAFRDLAPLDPADRAEVWLQPTPSKCTPGSSFLQDREFVHTHCINGVVNECTHRERVRRVCLSSKPLKLGVASRSWISTSCHPTGGSCSYDSVACGTKDHWCAEDYEGANCTGMMNVTCDGLLWSTEATGGVLEGGQSFDSGSDGGVCLFVTPEPYDMLRECEGQL